MSSQERIDRRSGAGERDESHIDICCTFEHRKRDLRKARRPRGRRIFTDGRDWPTNVEPSFLGISLGHWIDTDGVGRYDVLEVETRNMNGPRSFDASGLPLHAENQTVVKERYTFDKNERDVIHNEVTVFDHALTHPWTVTKHYRRSPNRHPWWVDDNCMENNNHIRIQGEAYFLSADGLIMPAKKGQRPSDLRYFNQPRK